MKTVRARGGLDGLVTAEVLARAVELGNRRRTPELHATELRHLKEMQAVLIGFADRSAVVLPVANYPELAMLSDAELDDLEIGFGGTALCLEARDMHVSIAGLVSASVPLMALAATLVAARNGGRSSEAKARAARANGMKGGRPRKQAAG